MRVTLVIPLILLLAMLPAISQSQGPVAIFISGPDAAGTGKAVALNVTVAGGPAEEDGLFKIKVYLKGSDLTGASPLEESPLERSSSNRTFSFNVTMPQAEQAVEVVVEANSTKDASWASGSSSKRIDVLVPVLVTAKVENKGSLLVRDLPVLLYLDGKRVADTKIDSLGPGESRVVTLEYLPVGLGVGTHTLELRVDLNGDGVIDPALGEVLLQRTFVKEGEPINPLYIVLGAVAAFVGALFVGAAIRQRRAAKK